MVDAAVQSMEDKPFDARKNVLFGVYGFSTSCAFVPLTVLFWGPFLAARSLPYRFLPVATNFSVLIPFFDLPVYYFIEALIQDKPDFPRVAQEKWCRHVADDTVATMKFGLPCVIANFFLVPHLWRGWFSVATGYAWSTYFCYYKSRDHSTQGTAIRPTRNFYQAALAQQLLGQEYLDDNKDGEICFAEFVVGVRSLGMDFEEEMLRGEFNQLDRDGNGVISLAEFCMWRREQFEEKFDLIDADGNGSISPEELRAFLASCKVQKGAIERVFRTLDRNRDGRISKAEFRRHLSQPCR